MALPYEEQIKISPKPKCEYDLDLYYDDFVKASAIKSHEENVGISLINKNLLSYSLACSKKNMAQEMAYHLVMHHCTCGRCIDTYKRRFIKK